MDQKNKANEKGFHWGHALIIFFVCYISYLVFIVIKSRTVDHSLVTKDYYAQDLAYQNHYDKLNNRSLLKKDLNIETIDSLGEVKFDFGQSYVVKEMNVNFYRASDSSLDFELKFENFTGQITVPTKQLKHGKWTIGVEWKDEVRSYYKSKEVFIQGV